MVKRCMEPDEPLVFLTRQHILGGVCDEELWKYEVEEDDDSLQFWSIWQQVQVNRKANMVLLSRVFQ